MVSEQLGDPWAIKIQDEVKTTYYAVLGVLALYFVFLVGYDRYLRKKARRAKQAKDLQTTESLRVKLHLHLSLGHGDHRQETYLQGLPTDRPSH